MSNNPKVTQDQILNALRNVQEPELGGDLVTRKMIRDLSIADGQVSFTVVLTTPACPLKDVIYKEAERYVLAVPGVQKMTIQWDAQVPQDSRLMGRLNIGVRNAVAVASGKGGVGKSTVATNLAVALAMKGARVGLLDADIYGPNIPIMMGVHERLRARAPSGKLLPLESYGVQLMSIGFLIDPKEPMIWRGPMLDKAIRQFLNDVEWGNLDYLIVDLPPGTGDAQLSLSQALPLTGAVIVTTPQDVALADVRRGMAMFVKVEVPLLGVVENMSYFVCGHCGEQTDIFGRGGGERISREKNVPFLGQVPLDPLVRQGGDAGQPIVILDADSPAALAITHIAELIAARVSVINLADVSVLPLEITVIN